MIENHLGNDYVAVKDQLLSQTINNVCYMDAQANRFEPVYDMSLTQEYADLRAIPSQDLLPASYAENSQSIEELCLQERKDIKAKHNVLPDLEEHDKGGFNFRINPQWNKTVKWLFSQTLNRIYIKTNEIISLSTEFKPRADNEVFFVRVMMVYNSEVSEPVVRCENHSSKDRAEEKNVKQSVVRCENTDVIYQGYVEGKNISDRLSILVPLGCVQSNDDGLVKHTIALKFVCQNSCVGRRETSIIFHLEDINGEILAKKMTAIKICSCPKRDMNKDEAVPQRKRSSNDICPVGKKILKFEDGSGMKIEMKQEVEPDDDMSTAQSPTDTADELVNASTGFKLTLDLPDMDSVLHVAECAFNKVAGQMALDPENKTVIAKMRGIKKLYTRLQQTHGQK